MTVIGKDNSRHSTVTYWFCKCDCGNPNILSIAKSSLTQGSTTSCGCARSKLKKQNPNKYDLSGTYGIGWTSNTGKKFYFDLEDFDKIKNYCWYENDNGYIVTQRFRKTIRMHRLVMDVNDDDIQIDHIYHNKNDNRKEFLRKATNAQNSWNKKCKGVYYNSEKEKYVGFVTVYGKKFFKYFDSEKQAIQYRKMLEQKYYKEFAYCEYEGEIDMGEIVEIKYFDKDMEPVEMIAGGDWIDLRSAETVEMKTGDFKLIPLGVGMRLPHGYEAHVVPRSSTFKKFGVIQVNSQGVIDNSYCGEEDQWMFPALAMRDTVIHKNDRICQFRIVKNQPQIEFMLVDHLQNKSRGGFGSTGVK